MGEHAIAFVDGLGPGAKVRMIRQSDVTACRFHILVPEHYREDGSCRCDDAGHREQMIRAWGYTAEDFEGIALR